MFYTYTIEPPYTNIFTNTHSYQVRTWQIPNEPSSTYPNKYFSLVQNTNYENTKSYLLSWFKIHTGIVNMLRLQSGYVKPQ